MIKAKIQFLGAAKTVTGSASLIKFGKIKILIDCGMFQGPKEIRKKNWEIYNKDLASSIDIVILTHAHVDHSGLIPRLHKLGFRGKVYATQSTYELLQVLLPDSAYLQEEDAKHSRSKSNEDYRGPLYKVKEAVESLKYFDVVCRNQWFELAKGLSFRFLRAGHILGSSIVQISISKENGVRLITFSGDLGNGRQNVIKGPEDIFETDDLILESTYGDRLQGKETPGDELKQCILDIHSSKGALVIPAFSVGRTQEILYMIKQLEDKGEAPNTPVFVDSPMALEATEIYLHDSEDLKVLIKEGELIKPLSPSEFYKVKKVEDSIRLTKQPGPIIIISAAGMLTGGRILYHLKTRLPDKRNIVLFVGYQAENTKGRLLQQGLRTIRIHKENIAVKAQIRTIDSLSAHADSDDLINWISRFNKPPKRIFLNHGELPSLNALCYRIRYELGLNAQIAQPDQEYDLL